MESQRNSLRNLQSLYSLVVGIGLSYAVVATIDLGAYPVPIRFATLPYFVAYVVTLVPFYHGALRHLDVTYLERRAHEIRSGALMADFTILFVEAILLLALAVLLPRPLAFAWAMVTLLGIDVLWGFGAHLAFSQTLPRKAEVLWALLNLVSGAVLVVLLVVLETSLGTTTVFEKALAVIVPLVCTVRTIFDYWLSWEFYFPTQS